MRKWQSLNIIKEFYYRGVLHCGMETKMLRKVLGSTQREDSHPHQFQGSPLKLRICWCPGPILWEKPKLRDFADTWRERERIVPRRERTWVVLGTTGEMKSRKNWSGWQAQNREAWHIRTQRHESLVPIRCWNCRNLLLFYVWDIYNKSNKT